MPNKRSSSRQKRGSKQPCTKMGSNNSFGTGCTKFKSRKLEPFIPLFDDNVGEKKNDQCGREASRRRVRPLLLGGCKKGSVRVLI